MEPSDHFQGPEMGEKEEGEEDRASLRVAGEGWWETGCCGEGQPSLSVLEKEQKIRVSTV